MKEGNLFDTIDYLRILNRKERFHLLRGVLGKTTFCLADHFRTELESCLSDSLNGALSIPSHAFAAMDFHLDWIAMALHLATKGPQSARRFRLPVDRISNDGLFLGTQQDVDLLVAFRNGRDGASSNDRGKGRYGLAQRSAECQGRKAGPDILRRISPCRADCTPLCPHVSGPPEIPHEKGMAVLDDAEWRASVASASIAGRPRQGHPIRSRSGPTA